MAEPRNPDYRRKIKTAAELHEILGPRPRARKAIMCHGTFDVVHPGHIRHLLYAKSKAEVLIASLTCDEHVAKGEFRPYIPENLRAMNLAAIEAVDFVLIDRDPTPLNNLTLLQPDYFAKGYEYTDGRTHPRTREEMDVVEGYGGHLITTPGDIVYSSSALIEMAPPDIGIDKLGLLMENEGVDFDNLRQTLDMFEGIEVHVVGDTIVDSYSHATMIGGMTKTPTISVRFEERIDFAGGAAVVAKHLAAAGGRATLSTVLGNDELKDFVLDDLESSGVRCRPIIDDARPTTNKNVFVAEGYHLLKVDTLDNSPISDKVVLGLQEAIAGSDASAVVFSDYRHGIFNTRAIPRLIGVIPEGTYRVADSQVASRWGNILDFNDFDLITPNEREARFALGDQDIGVRPLGEEVYRQAGCKTLILKLGERGLITYRSQVVDDYRSFFVIDSFSNKVSDAVGAGDALLAYATLAMVATGNEVIASILGSFAAAVECENAGNVPVTQDQVRDKIAAAEQRFNFGGDRP